MGPVLGWLTAAAAAKKVLQASVPTVDVPAPQAPTTPAAPAAAPTPHATSPQMGGDTVGNVLSRKARGKKALLIQPSSGAAQSGTGLNI